MQNHYTPLDYAYTDSASGLRLESPLHTLADLLTRPAALCRADDNATIIPSPKGPAFRNLLGPDPYICKAQVRFI